MDTSASGAITSAVSGLQGELITIGTAGVVISAAVFALTKGWGVLRRLVK